MSTDVVFNIKFTKKKKKRILRNQKGFWEHGISLTSRKGISWQMHLRTKRKNPLAIYEQLANIIHLDVN